MTEKKSKKTIHPEMLVGLSAVVIGVCALGVSLYETSLMREEQRAAVIPLVELARSHWIDDNAENQNKWRLSMHAENVGIGPARVADFRVTVDGEPHKTWRGGNPGPVGRRSVCCVWHVDDQRTPRFRQSD